MNPRHIAGLAFLLLGAIGMSGCSQPVRNDGHLFEQWADDVAAIPIDDGSKPAQTKSAESKPAETKPAATDAASSSPLKIDLVDGDSRASQALGLRAAVAMVDSQLAGLKRHISPDASPVKAVPDAPADAASAAPLFMAQLAAFPTRKAAEGAWARLKALHPDAFSGLSARFEPVDLGARGVWTRLQAGPLPSRDQASAVCAEAGVNDRWCVTQSRG